MAQASEEVAKHSKPKVIGRPEGSKDGPDVKRRPDVRLNAILTAIRAAEEAGFDLTVDKVRGIVLTPKDADKTEEQ